jgi:hypothetical protein
MYRHRTLFALSSLTQCDLIVFRNDIIPHRRSRAHHLSVVRVQIYLEKPARMQAGQHVNL